MNSFLSTRKRQSINYQTIRMLKTISDSNSAKYFWRSSSLQRFMMTHLNQQIKFFGLIKKHREMHLTEGANKTPQEGISGFNTSVYLLFLDILSSYTFLGTLVNRSCVAFNTSALHSFGPFEREREREREGGRERERGNIKP